MLMFKICMEKIKIISLKIFKGLIPLALNFHSSHHSPFSKVIVTNKQNFSQQIQYM